MIAGVLPWQVAVAGVVMVLLWGIPQGFKTKSQVISGIVITPFLVVACFVIMWIILKLEN